MNPLLIKMRQAFAMRIWTIALFAFAFASEAAAAGAYASLPARDGQACARLCADDGLCVAWRLTAEGACQLRATTPEAPSGLANGFSQRAPASLRQAFVNLTPPAASAQPTEQSSAAAPADTANDDTGLLGGPEPRDQTSELRLGLRN